MPHPLPPRRRLLLSALTATLLAACGGGGDGDDPAIDDFSAERTAYFVGERAILSVRFRGHRGEVDRGVGAVSSGVRVQTPWLEVDTTFTLTVHGNGPAPAARSITLPVSYRDRFQPLPESRPLSGHAAVSLTDGSVLLIGGSRGLKTLSERIDRFDPATRDVMPLATMQEGRAQPQAVLLPDGQVLIGGGSTSGHDSRLLERLDPRSGQVQPAGRLSVPRVDMAAVVLADGRVLFCGGSTAGEGAELGISRSCDLWDPATQAVRRLDATMTAPRSGHRMTRLRDGRVLVSGGFSTATPYRYAELFDPVSETFRPVNAPVREVLSQQVAVLHTDGSVLLMGGETYTAEGLVPRAEVWRFDAGSDTFSARPPLARGRTLAAAVALRDGRVLLFGGQTEPDRHSASAERYDPVAGGQALAALDRERAYLSANRLPDGRVLVAGGESTQGAFADQLLIYE